MDGLTNEKLANVNIVIPGHELGGSTDVEGKFRFKLPSGQYKLLASYIGYETEELTVDLNQNQNIQIKLWPVQEQLEEIEVSSTAIKNSTYLVDPVKLNSAEIKAIPTFMGEADVLKIIQLLPGVQGGSEGSTGFYVRGGSPDQNLVLLDGVPIYNVSHLFGLFSTFNADIIDDVELLKGGFPARYGGRLSSVLNISTKEGNFKEYNGEGALSLVAPKLLLEGPIIKDKTSFIISGRRSIFDLVITPFLGDNPLAYFFGDFNAKVNHRINTNNQLSVSYFYSQDRFTYEYDAAPTDYQEQSGINWKNHTLALNWDHSFNSKLSMSSQGSFNNYNFNTFSEQVDSNEAFSLNYQSLIEDIALRTDFKLEMTPKQTLRFGAGYTNHTFKPGALQLSKDFDQLKLEQEQNLSEPIFSNDVFVYLQDEWKVLPRFALNLGLHYALYDVQTSTYQSLQPRISASYFLKDNWTLTASYTEMTQFLHLLSNTGLGVPTDLWVSATDMVDPQQSQQYSLTSTTYLKQKTWEITGALYYKEMQNLIEYEEGASYITQADWQNVVETDGIGLSYGLEVLLRKSKGNTTGWISYTLAQTSRTFSNLNQGKSFAYRYDRRHNVAITLNHKLNSRIDFSATWVYQTGIAFTAPIASSMAQGSSNFSEFSSAYVYEVEQLSDRNSYRYPAYHRLDLGINFRKKKKWGSRVINVGVYNAYNRINPFFIDIKPGDDGSPTATLVGLFPILPSVSYSFKF